jgi:hypothetical protein
LGDLKIKRLFLTVKKSELINDEQLIARYKWGCDGSAGQNEQKQQNFDDNIGPNYKLISSLTLVYFLLIKNRSLLKINCIFILQLIKLIHLFLIV